MKHHRYGEMNVVDCVMALDETFYCYETSTDIRKEGLRHHSGILSGQPVLFAGAIGIKEGKIFKITMKSGHYKTYRKKFT